MWTGVIWLRILSIDRPWRIKQREFGLNKKKSGNIATSEVIYIYFFLLVKDDSEIWNYLTDQLNHYSCSVRITVEFWFIFVRL